VIGITDLSPAVPYFVVNSAARPRKRGGRGEGFKMTRTSVRHVAQAAAFIGGFWATVHVAKAMHAEIGTTPLWIGLVAAAIVYLLFQVLDHSADKAARRKLALAQDWQSRTRFLRALRQTTLATPTH
jgi:hypothetical protein